MHNLTWRAVDCPADELPIQLVFSSTTSTEYYFAVHVWDMRVPLAKVEVRAPRARHAAARLRRDPPPATSLHRTPPASDAPPAASPPLAARGRRCWRSA